MYTFKALKYILTYIDRHIYKHEAGKNQGARQKTLSLFLAMKLYYHVNSYRYRENILSDKTRFDYF